MQTDPRDALHHDHSVLYKAGCRVDKQRRSSVYRVAQNKISHHAVVRCSGYIVYRWIQRSARIKQLQEFLKSDHWLQRYCILSGGVFYFEPPCIVYDTCDGLLRFCKSGVSAKVSDGSSFSFEATLT